MHQTPIWEPMSQVKNKPEIYSPCIKRPKVTFVLSASNKGSAKLGKKWITPQMNIKLLSFSPQSMENSAISLNITFCLRRFMSHSRRGVPTVQQSLTFRVTESDWYPPYGEEENDRILRNQTISLAKRHCTHVAVQYNIMGTTKGCHLFHTHTKKKFELIWINSNIM